MEPQQHFKKPQFPSRFKSIIKISLVTPLAQTPKKRTQDGATAAICPFVASVGIGHHELAVMEGDPPQCLCTKSEKHTKIPIFMF